MTPHSSMACFIKYFSLLRPWHEIRIVKEFVKYKKYFPVFFSCNANLKITKKASKKWCGVCPKCVFVWTMLSAFISKKELIKIFSKNLYADQKLKSLFWELLGKGNFKPFECVGTPEEMKVGMWLASERGEFDHDFIMKKFKKEILSRLKDIKKLERKVMRSSGQHNVPEGFLQYLRTNR